MRQYTTTQTFARTDYIFRASLDRSLDRTLDLLYACNSRQYKRSKQSSVYHGWNSNKFSLFHVHQLHVYSECTLNYINSPQWPVGTARRPGESLFGTPRKLLAPPRTAALLRLWFPNEHAVVLSTESLRLIKLFRRGIPLSNTKTIVKYT